MKLFTEDAAISRRSSWMHTCM